MTSQLKYIKAHAKWLIVITIIMTFLIIAFVVEVVNWKRNYTKLWRWVAEIEKKCQ